MPRHIRLSADRRALSVQFEYDLEILAVLRGFRGASYEPHIDCWLVPLEHMDTLVEALTPLGFSVAADVVQAAPATFTVRELNNHIKVVFTEHLSDTIWVRGEVSSFERNQRRGYGHMFFELVDKPEGGDNIAARLGAVVFQSQRPQLRWRLKQSPHRVGFRDGLEVRLRGRVDFYPPSGRVQLIVDDIDPAFSVGQLARKRAEILQNLASRGLLHTNRDKPWPSLPLRVGLITARGSDAYWDFVRTLESAPYAFEVCFVPASVQGGRTEGAIVSALRVLASRADALDLAVIVRGGGAQSDLAWLDNQRIAEAIAQHPLKVLVGIGHEQDRGVLDEIAARAKTPTAAAEACVARVAQSEQALQALALRLAERVRSRLEGARDRAQVAAGRLQHLSRQALDRAHRTEVAIPAQRLALAVQRSASVARARIDQVAARLPISLRHNLASRLHAHSLHAERLTQRATRALIGERHDQQRRGERLAQAGHRAVARGAELLARQRARLVAPQGLRPLRDAEEHAVTVAARVQRTARAALEFERQRLSTAAAELAARDPKTALARGFALVYDRDGRVVREAHAVHPGDSIRVHLGSGVIGARVEDVNDPSPSSSAEQ